jgi:fructose-1,6-bisphosphatase I
MLEKITIQTFLKDFTETEEPLRRLLTSLATAAKAVAAVLRASAIRLCDANPLNEGEENVHGEKQSHMDVFADREFMRCLAESGIGSVVISEEQKELTRLNNSDHSAIPYIVALDPLDGSANQDVNFPTGSIFGIFKSDSRKPVHEGTGLTNGKDQVAAGYVLYGAVTIMVLAEASGVNGFTLEETSGEFVLTHPGMRIPQSGTLYAVNDGNYHSFRPGIQNYIRYCRQQREFGDQPYAARYTGSMVADIHRMLLKGGIFLYPEMSHARDGKLRLAYECYPMAYIIERAGGKATTGNKRTLDVVLAQPHQRAPVVIGSRDMVTTAERFFNVSIPIPNEI